MLAVFSAVILFTFSLASFGATSVSLEGAWRGEDPSDVFWGGTVQWVTRFKSDGTFILSLRGYEFGAVSKRQIEEGRWTFDESTQRLRTETLSIDGKKVNASDPHFKDVYEVTRISQSELMMKRVDFDPRYRKGLTNYRIVSVPDNYKQSDRASTYSGERWVPWAAIICIATNADYASTPVAKYFSRSYLFTVQVKSFSDDSNRNQCLHSKRWISDDFCRDLLNQNLDVQSDLNDIQKRYDVEIGKLDDFNICRRPKTSSALQNSIYRAG